MGCALCETRRPRRYCPAVRGEICSLCCGAAREVTVECPLDCQYLRESRLREKPAERNASEFPNQDIRVSEKLLRANEQLLTFLSLTIFRTAMEIPGLVDSDVLEAQRNSREKATTRKPRGGRFTAVPHGLFQ